MRIQINHSNLYKRTKGYIYMYFICPSAIDDRLGWAMATDRHQIRELKLKQMKLRHNTVFLYFFIVVVYSAGKVNRKTILLYFLTRYSLTVKKDLEQ